MRKSPDERFRRTMHGDGPCTPPGIIMPGWHGFAERASRKEPRAEARGPGKGNQRDMSDVALAKPEGVKEFLLAATFDRNGFADEFNF
ncbi:hypothetical protein PLCT2_02116 [Planctomycetaceae bacterium]|nr:hypothetical protein PLCT2_02116 [Planctomycetaceae bacterium]